MSSQKISTVFDNLPIYTRQCKATLTFPGFHSRISLVADEIFAHEKCSDKICYSSKPFDSANWVNIHKFADQGQKLGLPFVFMVSADEIFPDDKRNTWM